MRVALRIEGLHSPKSSHYINMSPPHDRVSTVAVTLPLTMKRNRLIVGLDYGTTYTGEWIIYMPKIEQLTS
jgi:hypothetical protein